MFERKDNKKEALLDLDGRLSALNKRYTAVKDAGTKIQAMVTVRLGPGAPGEPAGFQWMGREEEERAGDSFKMTSVVAESTLFNPR